MTADDKQTREQFCVAMQEKLEEEEFYERFVFGDEATFPEKAKSTGIMFAFGAKEILMRPLSIRGTSQK